MATKIRLFKMGAKKRPFYRIVVADERSPRSGKYIENTDKSKLKPSVKIAKISIAIGTKRSVAFNGARKAIAMSRRGTNPNKVLRIAPPTADIAKTERGIYILFINPPPQTKPLIVEFVPLEKRLKAMRPLKA